MSLKRFIRITKHREVDPKWGGYWLKTFWVFGIPIIAWTSYENK